jgi:hypothetical protein
MPTRLIPRATELILIGVVAFVLSLPVAALGVGTLPTRIHHPDVLERLRIPLAGRLPAPVQPNEEGGR